MTRVILMMIMEIDIFIIFIKNDRCIFSYSAELLIVRIIILSSFQRWQASPAYSLPALPSFFLSLLHSGDCVGVVCLCKWPLRCLCRFCGCFVFLFLILLIPSAYDGLFYPNLVLVRLLTLYHSFQCLQWHGMWCSSFLSFFPALIFFLFQRLRWHGLSSCRLQSKLKHQECKFSKCNFSRRSFKVPQHFTGEQTTNDLVLKFNLWKSFSS